MSQEEYDKKLRSVHRFIPFLENIITQLKDPKMKNREQQLSKMESLYQMIMDKNKKLKLETLNKCEDVIIKLFYKVRGKNASLPPIYYMNTSNKQGNERKSVDLISLAGETMNKQDNFNELYGSSSSNNFKSPRKPPISYSDLECLEKDVAHELEKKMSLQELNTLRYRLCRELEDSKPDEINTTIRNKPVLTKMNATSPDKNRRKAEITMNVQRKNDSSVTRKIDPKPTAPKVLKEAGDLFGNAFSEIDKSYELGSKKKEDSKYSKEKKDVETEDEKASLKQLSEKAAQLRKNGKSIEKTKVGETDGAKCPFEINDGTLSRANDSDNVPFRNLNTLNDDFKDKEKSVPVKVSRKDNSKEKPEKEKNEIDDFEEKNEIEKNVGSKEKTKQDTNEMENSKEKNKKGNIKPNADLDDIPLTNSDNKAVDSSENKEKSESSTDVSNFTNNGDCKDQAKIMINEADIVSLKIAMSEVIPKDESNKVNKIITDKDKDHKILNKAHEHSDKNRLEKEKSRNKTEKITLKYAENKEYISKSKSSKCPDDKEKKRSDPKGKSHKSDHKKDKEEKHKDKNRERSHKEHDKDKDRKDRSKDKGNKEKKLKSEEIKDGVEKEGVYKNKDFKIDKKEKPEQDIVKKFETKQKDVALVVSNKITFESENPNNVKNYQDDYEQLTQKLNEMIETTNKPQEPKIEIKPQTREKPLEEVKAETKAINRDPRLKQCSTQNLSTDRIAFKYNPKPKRQEADVDLEKNVVDSIEKSMKESNVPMPPTLKLTAPPIPPNDLFSPESPDEIDKMAVPPILNDLLLNPKTTGMLNEVVSALRRSNNDNNLISIAVSANVCSGESNPLGQTFNQTPALRFSPPVPKMHFEAPPVEAPIFSPPKQTRCFAPFSDQKEFEYQTKRNNVPSPYEERIGQGYFAERTGSYVASSLNYSSPTLNYVPPSPSYGPSVTSFVPPSPNYVPPSPIYEGNAESFRDMNYQNFQGSNPQRFFDGDRGSIRSKGLLGDAPSRLPFKNPYQKNYDSFNSFGLRGSSSNLAETRTNYYGGSRDPRINMNRGLHYTGQDLRPIARESRMTYREYKEQKERENREREMREREMKEKEELETKQKGRDETETNANSVKERENVSNSQIESENDRDRTTSKVEEKESDRSGRSRTRERSRDRYSRNRSSSRYRKDRDDYRNRGDRRDRNERRDRSRERSKFDKAYSVREKVKGLSSPLNELFNPKSTNGKGYSIQYKIPKKVKDEEQQKEKNMKNDDTTRREKASVKKNSSDEKFPQDNKLPPQNVTERTNEEKYEIPIKQIKVQGVESKEETVSNQKTDKNNEEENKNENEEKTIEIKLDTEQQTHNKDNKKCNIGEKKEEEENILSKFFQNLMKSGNKDEKKGALLSLISTFSDSFSNHQLQKITSIIKSEDNDDEPNEKEMELEKEDIPSTRNQLIEPKVDDKTDSILQGDIEKQIEDIEQEKEVPADELIEVKKCPENIQTRSKSDILKPELKSKIKTKSELDRLHDDIREMFIRDGVVTATGKRMCRILKDTSPQKSVNQEKLEEEAAHQETEKKITTPKRRGRKPGYRKNKETPEVEMKELTVILPKMSLDKIKTADEVAEKEKHCESDDKADKKEENSSEEEASEKTSPIRRGRHKKRNSWATGVIKRKPCPKSKKLRVQDVSDESEKKSVKDADAELDTEFITDKKPDIPKEGLHDVNYYLKIGQTKLQCKYCEVSTKWIAAHYRTEHPNEEVLSSRLAPHVAKAAIADSIKNREIYENDKEESISKHEFLCSFCEYKQITLPKFYRDHVSIHTGEFRHTCPYCSFSRSHIKTMQTHVTEVHAEEEAISRKPLISERAPNKRNIYAYICDLCNFTQMNLDNVKKHVENYHSQAATCQIHKIKVNCIEKIEEKTAYDNTVHSERPTRRSLKSSSQPEEIAVSPIKEGIKLLNVEEPPKEEEEAKKQEDEFPGSCHTSNTEEESNETDIPRNIQTFTRRTRKRGKSLKAPSPVKKRLKRRCTLNKQSTTDFDDDTFEGIEEKTAKNIDEAVFTSNTDIQEENKRIEEERLKTMQDINSTIKLRTSSDFVEKLSHKLKQEEEVKVKQEVEENVQNVLEKTPVKDLPVFEKSGIQNREAEPVSIRQESSQKVGKDSGKVNPINGVIEKLQGILGNPSTSCDNVASPNVSSEELCLPAIEPTFDDTPPSLEIAETKIFPKECVGNESIHPPPLIHMNNVEQTVEKNNMVNSEILNIGYVKVIKTMATYIYVCCLPPCIFSSRDRAAFARHCQYNHQWDENSPKTSKCLDCGETFACSEGGNLLTSALDHTNSHHSNFLGIKIGSIRISTNLFPESRVSPERPSTPPTISIPSPPGNPNGDDIDCFLNDEPAAENNEGENPFSFKIIDVVSLADENLTSLNTSDKEVESHSPDREPEPSQIQDSSPLSRINTISLLMSKCQSKQEEALSRKWPTAMKKFLSNHFDLYKCPDYLCVFTTNKRKMFDIHLRTHPNNKKKVNCLYCDKLIDFETSGDHYEKLHGMCRFSCSYCLYRCIAKDYMDIHQVLAHPDMQSRMQLLPKRDLEDKNSISILSEATKLAPITPYLCCDKEYLHQIPFIEHVEKCMKNTNFRCYYGKGLNSCQTPHNNSKDLVNHWGTSHDVYPLKCAYCSIGDFDLNVMMIHLVLEHPTLPPDIIDRYNVPVSRNKKPPTISSVQCNFKELIFKLKSFSNSPVPKTAESLQLPVTSPTVTPPKTMQTAFENFVQMSNSKTISSFPKVAPLPSIALLKSTSKANVINAGSLVYCLSPSPNSQKSLLKAIVVNKDKTMVSQKVQLVAPMSSKTDGKYQIVNKIMPMAPPKLAPLTTIQNLSSMNKVITSSSDVITLNSPDTTNNVRVTTEIEEGVCIQKDGNVAGDSADMENLEEPMVVIDDDFVDNERNEAVDPLSLDIEDCSTGGQQPNTPQSNATPMHDCDSDSKDVDQHDMLVQKSGLVGYQLFRCAKCDMFFPGSWQFKEHLINSTQCRFENSPQKPYKCFHCGKYLKHYTNLLDHLGYHGPPRFTCSLCNKKFSHANQVKYHMKTQHNVVNVQMQPLIQTKANLNNDSFIAKPVVIKSNQIKSTIKETNSEIEAHRATEVKTVYYSFEADQIPQKSILSYDITCGHCKKFKNKVRSNIVRHLLLHQNDKDFTVPDTAPVNPVPCLEKNEKMFDKMCNLASSSHTGGRMGGQQKGESSKDKAKENNYPAFVPINKRYQCCAVGCNYLCLEEGNLRHHLTALHMEDLNFVCVHCKRDLSDAVDVDTIIKHLKLHDLHLYKCSSCDYMHNLKHKIERHIGDDHKNKESTVVIIRAMDAEPYDENQQQPFIPVTVNQKSQKPWRCCMCKYKCQTEEEVMNHVKNKHNLDCRYKCALCTFKTNEVSEFKEHFKTNHPDGEVDIISVYHKDDENSAQVPENDQFDTTPLWLRDKPRVRHIRGILFEEDTAMKKKTTPVKTDQLKEPPGTFTTKKRKRSISTVNEYCQKSEEEGIEPKKEALEPKIGNIPLDKDIIIIDDDEVEEPLKTDNKTIDPVENQDLNDVELICRFGDIGMPLNKHFKCPKCEKYKTTKMRDFIQHVAGELRYYRFLCKICQEKFITLENIQMHCIDYHDCSVKSVTHLPVDEAINKWLTLLLIGQRKIMISLGLACDEVPAHIEDFLGRMEVFPRKSIKCKECSFTVSGSQALDRHMKYNHPHIAFTQKSQPSNPSEPAEQTNMSSKKRFSEASLDCFTESKKIKMTKTIPMVKDKYVCNDCGIEFNSVPEMEYHFKENHNGVVGYTIKKTNLPINAGVLRSIYRCRYCATTGTKGSLEVHISNDHPGQKLDLYRFSCGFCSAKFDNLKSFRQHFKSHDLPDMFYFDVYDRKVALQPSITTPKVKIYKCPKCPYRNKSSNPSNIKHHLTLHAKPFQCGLCQGLFKTKRQARTHHLNEHPHNIEVITTRQDMFKLADQMLKEVIDTATVAEERDNTITEDSIEEEPLELTIQPEVLLKSYEDEFVDIETIENDKSGKRGLSRLVHKEKKHFAKKSTGLNIKPDETKEYFSFYGQKAESVDLKKINTNFEIAGSKVKISCDQLGRIYNLNPIIRLKDCMTLIIDDDEASTS